MWGGQVTTSSISHLKLGGGMSQEDIAVIHDSSITEHGDNVASSSSQQGGADAIIQIPEEQSQPTPVVKVNPRYLLQTQDTLTPRELDDVTTVFKQFEIGLREGCINVKDLHTALESLGVQVMEQEVIDMTNAIARDGLVFFPEFCSVVLKKFREEDEDQFAQILFKMMCGTEPFPEHFRAKKYKIHKKFLSKQEFKFIMMNLPEHVSEDDIEAMFETADLDKDDCLSYDEFYHMIVPSKPPTTVKPSKAQFVDFYRKRTNHE